jgi:hypothetical protein
MGAVETTVVTVVAKMPTLAAVIVGGATVGLGGRRLIVANHSCFLTSY